MSVLQNEGSSKSAVLNCISMALVDAGITLKDLIVSCTVGTIGGETVVDMTSEEEYDSTNEFVMSYLPGSRELDCLELRKAKLSEEGLRSLHGKGIAACQELYQLLRGALMDYSIRRMLIY